MIATTLTTILAEEYQRFMGYHGVIKAIYLFYLTSGLFLPWGHYRRWQKFRKGNNGIGDSCIKSEIYMTFWRTAPFLYSCTVITAYPFLVAVSLDIIGRIAVIAEMCRCQRRSNGENSGVALLEMEGDML